MSRATTVFTPVVEQADVKKNVGGLDRKLRLVVAGLLLAVAVAYPRIRKTEGNRRTLERGLLLWAGVDLLVTSLLQRCPVNYVLGIDTCPTDDEDAAVLGLKP